MLSGYSDCLRQAACEGLNSLPSSTPAALSATIFQKYRKVCVYVWIEKVLCRFSSRERLISADAQRRCTATIKALSHARSTPSQPSLIENLTLSGSSTRQKRRFTRASAVSFCINWTRQGSSGFSTWARPIIRVDLHTTIILGPR
jgi:hypothetical protein